uniref:RING-type domain-containing protein n=1 Tax=Leptocylindrus danicus TaxID=163516 RepID=A0A7S2LQR6_9STRA|mmetsp:Transcript_8250/g.12277  ORF Transcript_8250/g.12277 Transcript_8250/m.12277 type:complete len:181 (+) Transcript_8250:113-655(+)
MSGFCSSAQHVDYNTLCTDDLITYSCPLFVFVFLFVCGYIADCYNAWLGRDNMLKTQSAEKQKLREAKVNQALRTMMVPLHHLSDKNAEDDCCPICQCEYEANDEVACIYPCKHVFHRKCISDWLVRHSKSDCPCCRANVVEKAANDFLEGHDEGWVDYLVTVFFYSGSVSWGSFYVEDS